MEQYFSILFHFYLVVSPFQEIKYEKIYDHVDSDFVEVRRVENKVIVQNQSQYLEACPCPAISVYYLKPNSEVLDSMKIFYGLQIEQYDESKSTENKTVFKIFGNDSLVVSTASKIKDRVQIVKRMNYGYEILSESYREKWVISSKVLDTLYQYGLSDQYFYFTKYYYSNKIDSSKQYLVSDSQGAQLKRRDYFEYNSYQLSKRIIIDELNRVSVIDYRYPLLSIHSQAQAQTKIKFTGVFFQVNGQRFEINKKGKNYSSGLKF